MEIKRFFNHILKSTINILNHRILFYGIIINQRDLKMHPKSNPEEFENNQSFMVKSVKSKLKCLVTKEVSNYTIRNFVFYSRIKNWLRIICQSIQSHP
jgi:hypothetical protein